MLGEVDTHRPLHNDSLLAVDLSSWIVWDFSAIVRVCEILIGSTLATVGTLVASKNEMKHGE